MSSVSYRFFRGASCMLGPPWSFRASGASWKGKEALGGLNRAMTAQEGVMAIVIRKLPDLSGEAQRQQFWSGLGDTTLIIHTRTHQASQPLHAQPLSVRAAFGGRAEHSLGTTRLAVDDDSYLIVNAGTEAGLRIQAPTEIHYLGVWFPQTLVREALGRATPDEALEQRHPRPAAVPFAEHLRPHDDLVTPALMALARAVDAGDGRDAAALDEMSLTLLDRLARARSEEAEHVANLAQVRQRTKREIHRRIWAATDFLLSCYDRPLTLQQLADVACLAKYHFLRMFVAVHGLTPMEYLRCKRVAVASRLLASTGLSLVEIARGVGVADRSTLLRLFVEHCNLTPEEYRRRQRGVLGETGPGTRLKPLLDARVARHGPNGSRRRAAQVESVGRQDAASSREAAPVA
jgi:AraC-like DNA-binding protein